MYTQAEVALIVLYVIIFFAVFTVITLCTVNNIMAHIEKVKEKSSKQQAEDKEIKTLVMTTGETDFNQIAEKALQEQKMISFYQQIVNTDKRIHVINERYTENEKGVI